jgi:hypothetical protein
VGLIMDLLKRNRKHVVFGESQEAVFRKVVIQYTSGNTPILRHIAQERPAMIETDALYFAIRIELSQQLEDSKIDQEACLSRKLVSPIEFNYDICDNEIPAIVYALQKCRHYILSTERKITICLDHQNLEYFNKKVKLTR